MGAIEDIEGMCTSGFQAMWAAASAHAPLVVVAEGKTGTEFPEAGLRLLYPHLVGLIGFMNFDRLRIGQGGQAFAAAGIAHRVVALFDNDTAVADALRRRNRANLSPEHSCAPVPPITIAVGYPTPGRFIAFVLARMSGNQNTLVRSARLLLAVSIAP